MSETLKKWIQVLSYPFVGAVGFLIGVAWEWYRSPLNSHICFDSGKELTLAVVKQLSYWWGWGLMIGVPGVIATGSLVACALAVWKLLFAIRELIKSIIKH